MNRINAEFVKIVRKSGGANETRWLLPGGFADLEKTCDMLKLPDDPRCIVSIHYYLPPGFVVAEPWAPRWKASYNWGTEEEHAQMDTYFDKVKTMFIDKGIPVILGEYGCLLRNKNPASRIDYFRSIVKRSTDLGICLIF